MERVLEHDPLHARFLEAPEARDELARTLWNRSAEWTGLPA